MFNRIKSYVFFVSSKHGQFCTKHTLAIPIDIPCWQPHFACWSHKKEIFHICDQSFRHSRVCDNFIIFVIIIWVQEATRNGLSRRSSAFASIMSKLACKHSYYFSTSLLFPSWRLPFFNQEAHGWPSIAINKS